MQQPGPAGQTLPASVWGGPTDQPRSLGLGNAREANSPGKVSGPARLKGFLSHSHSQGTLAGAPHTLR